MDFAYWLAAPFCDAPREARFCAGEVCTALCGRCLGLFAAFLIGALLLRVTEPREDRARVALDERALQLAVAGLLVAAFDAFALDSALPIRLATGAAGGFGLAVLAGAASAARRGGVPLHLGPSRRNQALTAGALCLTAVAAALFLVKQLDLADPHLRHNGRDCKRVGHGCQTTVRSSGRMIGIVMG